MSKTEENKSLEDEDSINLKTFTLDEIKEMKFEAIFEHIEKLYKIIRSKTKKYKHCKIKLKSLEKKYAALEKQQQRQDKEQEKQKKKHPPVRADGASADETLSAHIKESRTKEVNGDTSAVNHEETYSDPSESAFDFVNEMRQVAQHAQNLNEFIYEPTSGLYYDQKSGYYYNAEYGLYYDGNTGCYYSYNTQKKTFEFHSQVQVQATNSQADRDASHDIDDNDDDVEFDEFGGVITDPDKIKEIKREREELRQKHKERYKKAKPNEKENREKGKEREREKKRKRKKEKSGRDSDNENRQKKCREVEDGELSETSSESESDSSTEVLEFKHGSRFQDLARNYPPSLRIIVQESSVEKVKVGSLSIITYKGGSLGREGNHDVIIPDLNISKCHLKFKYDHQKSLYECIDMGSRNGTILNGVRMSVSQLESEAFELVHGSVLQIGSVKLLCHIHEGNRTCGLCEPGLLIEPEKPAKPSKTETVSLSHKEQLKKIQKKYGLENEKFVEGTKGNGNAYNDRAATRRIEVGSSSDKEKTQVASVDVAISSENKGFKMLSKLGWSKGEGLGKTSGALLEPINVTSNEGTKGLGCEEPTVSVSLTPSDKRRLESLKKTQERYQKADIFMDDQNSD